MTIVWQHRTPLGVLALFVLAFFIIYIFSHIQYFSAINRMIDIAFHEIMTVKMHIKSNSS